MRRGRHSRLIGRGPSTESSLALPCKVGEAQLTHLPRVRHDLHGRRARIARDLLSSRSQGQLGFAGQLPGRVQQREGAWAAADQRRCWPRAPLRPDACTFFAAAAPKSRTPIRASPLEASPVKAPERPSTAAAPGAPRSRRTRPRGSGFGVCDPRGLAGPRRRSRGRRCRHRVPAWPRPVGRGPARSPAPITPPSQSLHGRAPAQGSAADVGRWHRRSVRSLTQFERTTHV